MTGANITTSKKALFPLAALTVLALTLSGPAHASKNSPRPGGAQLLFAAEVTPADRNSSGFVDLSGDDGSGAGFYALPRPYREDARRDRAARAADGKSAIGAALASEAVGDEFDEGYVFGNSHSVFNPVDGVGTPFFGGYYPN